MTLLEAVKSSEKECLIITTQSKKQALLKALSREKVFKAMRFMSMQDLFNEVFFKMDQHTIFKASIKLNLKPNILKDFFQFIPLIDETKTYSSKELNDLKQMKLHMIEEGLIYYSSHQSLLFNDKTVLVDVPFHPLLNEALKRLKGYTNYTIIASDTIKNENVFKNNFATAKDEIVQVAHHIRSLLKDVSPKQIKVIMNSEEYLPTLIETFNAFQIPHFMQESEPLSQFDDALTLLDYLESLPDEPLYEQLKKAFEKIKPQPHQSERLRIYTKLLQTLNPLVLEEGCYQELKPFIKHLLDEVFIKQSRNMNAVEITQIDKIEPDDIKHLFILACAETYFPPVKTEDDFLSAVDKETINFPPANELNAVKKSTIIELIQAIPNVYLSYAKSGLTEGYFEATFLEELETIFKIKPMTIIPRYTSNYGEKFDLIQTKIQFDTYHTYHEDHIDLSHHYERFKSKYIGYDNQFTGLSNQTINQLLPEPLNLSYTKLNTYFKCKFRYLMQHLLKLEDVSDTLAIDIGVFFHDVLEHYIHEDKLTKSLLEETLEKVLAAQGHQYSKREMFFLQNSFNMLMKVFETIKTQHNRSDYSVKDLELNITKTFDFDKTVQFSGVIDKVLMHEVNDIKHFVLIDYKTGKPTLKLKESYFGFNSQLIFYVLLLKEVYKEDYLVTGFYEQTILPKPLKNKDNVDYETLLLDSLKLKGYTINDENIVFKIDQQADKEPFIEGMRFKNDGSFYANSKTFDKDDVSLLTHHIEQLINKAVQDILKGDFYINPKKDQNQKDLSCQYCQFKDICYKKLEDYQTLSVPKDDNALFDRLKEDYYGKD